VVIPATNRPVTLGSCLDAVLATDGPPDQVVVVTEPRGAGPAAARNAGARRTRAELVAFVDSDVLVHRDACTRIREAFARDPGLVAVFGAYDDTVATTGTVAAFRNLLHHTVHRRSAGEVGSFWAGLGAVRRGAFETAGGFDEERYPRPSIEDIELGGRLAPLGRIRLDSGLQGTHLKEWSLGTMVRTDFARRGVPWVELLVSDRNVPAHLNLGPRERASAAAALLLAWGVLRRRPAAVAVATAAEVLLNLDLLGLLHRRLGLYGATAGAGLHVLHQLTAIAAVPAGLASAATRRRRRRRTAPADPAGPRPLPRGTPPRR
jgi:Glycosyl transferase family 2